MRIRWGEMYVSRGRIDWGLIRRRPHPQSLQELSRVRSELGELRAEVCRKQEDVDRLAELFFEASDRIVR